MVWVNRQTGNPSAWFHTYTFTGTWILQADVDRAKTMSGGEDGHNVWVAKEKVVKRTQKRLGTTGLEFCLHTCKGGSTVFATSKITWMWLIGL